MARPSNKQRRLEFVRGLRDQGKSWVEIAEALRRDDTNLSALAALRLAHGWSQTDAATQWNWRWPDELKRAKGFSHWESWPVAGYAPSLRTLVRLAELYQCSVSDLLTGLGEYRHLDENYHPEG